MVMLGDGQLPLAAVRDQVQASIDLVVHVARHSDGRRRIVAVAEVDDGGTNGRTARLADGERVFSKPSRVRR
jgi:Flp pilus assembly CpaF family ATPase